MPPALPRLSCNAAAPRGFSLGSPGTGTGEGTGAGAGEGSERARDRVRGRGERAAHDPAAEAVDSAAVHVAGRRIGSKVRSAGEPPPALTGAAQYLHGQLVCWGRDHLTRAVGHEVVQAVMASYPDCALISIAVPAGVNPDEVDVAEQAALQLVTAGRLAITEAGWRLVGASHRERQRRYRARRAQRDAGGDASVTPHGDATPSTHSAGGPGAGGNQLDLNQVLGAPAILAMATVADQPDATQGRQRGTMNPTTPGTA